MNKQTLTRLIAILLILGLLLSIIPLAILADEADGVVIKLHYHRPDGDYTDYGYYTGLPYLEGFGIEVHYEFKPEQDESIKRFLAERGLTVYVTHTAKGGIVVKDGSVRIIGTVDIYTPDNISNITSEQEPRD